MTYTQFPVIDPVATGENIVRLRQERGLSVRDLQAYFGFDEPQAIYKWQRGKSLPTVDNLGLALANAKDKDNEFVKGVQMVYDGLLKALADHGAKPMVDLVGKELDPNFHEAIATLPSVEVEAGKISNVAKTGWTLNDKLLRAAQVVVSAGAPA